MVKLRISTLIRLGARHSNPVTSTRFEIFRPEENDRVSKGRVRSKPHFFTCAWGAGVVGAALITDRLECGETYLSDLRYMDNSELGDVRATRIEWNHMPEGTEVRERLKNQPSPFRTNKSLYSTVACLNDGEGMSREEIADWIDTLIEEHGYDLTVELEPEFIPQSMDLEIPEEACDMSEGDSLPADPQDVALDAQKETVPA